MPQFHLRPAADSLRNADSPSSSALYARILRATWSDPSHHRRSGRGHDPRVAVASSRRSRGDRGYSLRRRGDSRCLRRPRLCVDLSGLPGTRLRRSEGQPPAIALSTQGLATSVAFDDQASSVDGQVRRVSASFPLACWAENETARVLRLSGNTGGAQRWPRAARVFDNEPQAFESDARRRQNLDDQGSYFERSRRDRVVLRALADRIVFQGTEIDARFFPVQLSEFSSRASLGGDRHHHRAVLGTVARRADARPPLEQNGSRVVGTSTIAWFVCGLPSGMLGARAEIHGGSAKNLRRHGQTQKAPYPGAARGIPNRWMKNGSKGATSKLTLRASVICRAK